MTTIKTARDPTDSSVQTCQLGLTNSATVQTSISTYGTKFVTKYLTCNFKIWKVILTFNYKFKKLST